MMTETTKKEGPKEPEDVIKTLEDLRNYHVPSSLVKALQKFTSPSPKLRKAKNNTKLPLKNAFSNPERRARLQHLLDHPMCTCGAGEEITYISSHLPQCPENEGASVDFSLLEGKTFVSTLLSESYIKKNHPPLSLKIDFKGGKPVLKDQHPSHEAVLPSMTPASREEAIQIKNCFEVMMRKIGLNRADIERVGAKGGNHIDNLMQLVRKEQILYNTVYYEVIRQVTIGCMERGELLAEIRAKYVQLMMRMSFIVRDFQDQVLEHKLMNRRLLDTMATHSKSLESLIKQNETMVTRSSDVWSQLSAALFGLQRRVHEWRSDVPMVQELNELYELQRHRLTSQVDALTEEKQLWMKFSFLMASKLSEDLSRTAQSLFTLLAEWEVSSSALITDIICHGNTRFCRLRKAHDAWMSASKNVHNSFEHFCENTIKKWKKVVSNMRTVSEGLFTAGSDSVFKDTLEKLYQGNEEIGNLITSIESNFSSEVGCAQKQKLQKEVLFQELEALKSGEDLLSCALVKDVQNIVDQMKKDALGVELSHSTTKATIITELNQMRNKASILIGYYHTTFIRFGVSHAGNMAGTRVLRNDIHDWLRLINKGESILTQNQKSRFDVEFSFCKTNAHLAKLMRKSSSNHVDLEIEKNCAYDRCLGCMYQLVTSHIGLDLKMEGCLELFPGTKFYEANDVKHVCTGITGIARKLTTRCENNTLTPAQTVKRFLEVTAEWCKHISSLWNGDKKLQPITPRGNKPEPQSSGLNQRSISVQTEELCFVDTVQYVSGGNLKKFQLVAPWISDREEEIEDILISSYTKGTKALTERRDVQETINKLEKLFQSLEEFGPFHASPGLLDDGLDFAHNNGEGTSSETKLHTVKLHGPHTQRKTWSLTHVRQKIKRKSRFRHTKIKGHQ